jgi:hypothetical protein
MSENSHSKKANQKRGRRNRQRGNELQRQAVNIAKSFGLLAYNRDRGGAQHELGDVEMAGKYYGCKRRKSVPKYLMPEKEEIGVVFRGDRMEPQIAIPFDLYCFILSEWLKAINGKVEEEVVF